MKEEMNCNNMYNLTLSQTQSIDYDFIFQMRYEMMIMSINLILLIMLIKVSGIKSSMGQKTLYYQEENTQPQIQPQDEHQPLQDEHQPLQDEMTISIIKLLSDKKEMKAKQIISELNLECNKKYLNRTYLYPMKEKGILDSEEWFWKLS
tara:strand:+ start:188 stop:634 length:447 start_codon:yes stop_codon:yes gene_type:complete